MLLCNIVMCCACVAGQQERAPAVLHDALVPSRQFCSHPATKRASAPSLLARRAGTQAARWSVAFTFLRLYLSCSPLLHTICSFINIKSSIFLENIMYKIKSIYIVKSLTTFLLLNSFTVRNS